MTASCQCVPCRRCDYLECMCSTDEPPERKPAAGWVDMMSRGNWVMVPQRAEALEIGPTWARVYTYDGARHWWSTCYSDPASASFIDGTFDAAKLAAEDALRSIAAEILRAVGE